jgi:hypothetical protein
MSGSSKLKTTLLIVIALLILIPSMLGFCAKFIEFLHVFRGEAEGAFAIAPVLNYVLASLGFLSLLVWAIANGMFHDVEGPKYEMLHRERVLDEGIARDSLSDAEVTHA